jgi:hypothetical protein
VEATNVRKKSKAWVILVSTIILLVLLCGAIGGITILGNNAGEEVLTQTLSESLGVATTARFDFNVGTGNLTIDRLSGGEQLLASGTLEYLESQGRPTGTVDMNGHLYTLTLKASGGRQPGFQLPWAACNGETDWLIHLNPTLPSDITASSDGGNVKLNLAGTIVTHLVADTSGGNLDVVLPDEVSDLNVSAKTGGGNVTVLVGSDLTGSNTVMATSGAGNVVVRLPDGIAARIHATTGMGKLTIDPQFTKIDEHTYQSPNYDHATDKLEITVESGAGDVNVITK